MNSYQTSIAYLLLLFISIVAPGCAEKIPAHIEKDSLAEFSGSRTQGNIKLFMFSGDASVEDIKDFSRTLGCNMLYAYFYPDTVPISEIPTEEIRNARSFGEAYEVLYEKPGFASWQFVSRCFSAIPFVSDCYDSPARQNCR